MEVKALAEKGVEKVSHDRRKVSTIGADGLSKGGRGIEKAFSGVIARADIPFLLDRETSLRPETIRESFIDFWLRENGPSAHERPVSQSLILTGVVSAMDF